MLDIRQSIEYASYLSKIGWVVERVDDVNYFVKKIPLIGSVMKIQRPRQLDTLIVSRLAKRHHTFEIIIEPEDVQQSVQCMNMGYKLSKSPYLPTKTLHLDLKKKKNEILGQMRNDARSAINKNINSRLMTYNQEEIDQFRNSWKSAVGWKRYVPPLQHLIALKESFGDRCLFLKDSDTDSGAIFLIGNDVGYYWQAFTNNEGRKKQVQYKIVWEGILWAKKMGAMVFDFEGIYDSRFPNKSWLGFTHFKKSFGGKEIEYPGCLTSFKLPL